MTDADEFAELGHLIAGNDQAALDRFAARLDAEDEARRARLAGPQALAQAAAWYAGHGVAVFPLRAGEKRPATQHGLHDASTDPGQVRDWWAEMPQANIGIPTGALFTVIDVDPPHGWASLARMRGDEMVPATIGYAVTPRGGAHLYTPPSGDGNTAGLLPGIDIRGLGGYVVGPPSRSAAGTWRWVIPLDLAAMGASA